MVRGALITLAAVALLAGCGGGTRAADTTPKQQRQFHVVFPEGFTRATMAERVAAVAKIAKGEIHHPVKLSKRAYLAASRPHAIPGFGRGKLPLEGFLFPNTYNFDRTSTSADLVQNQLQEFKTEWGTVDMSYARSKNLTPYDVLKIASMIQAETAIASQNKLVAAVIYNRLHDGMNLGFDSTLHYGLHLGPNQDLTSSDLASDNPYNTRKFPGLPPTPIDNPGLAAIDAAAHPANVDYTYFLGIPHSKRLWFTNSSQEFYNREVQYGYAP
ncbi:MAG TPA: endolytic transglycosylase MltG [Gaiellaceae bacterium]